MRRKESEFGEWELTDISPTTLKMFYECHKKFHYRYIREEKTHNGSANLQGLSVHEVALEEYMGGGVQDVEALVDLIGMDFASRCETGDPRDYKTKIPVTPMEIMQGVEQVKTWARGFLNTLKTGKTPYGDPFNMPDVKATEQELCCEVELENGMKIRLRGYTDLVFDDDSLGDLKLASDYFTARWSESKALSEYQPVMYAKMHGTDTFRYVIIDKKMNFKKREAYSPDVRVIEVKLDRIHFDRLLEDIEYFVQSVDLFNEYENGFSPCRPIYDGENKQNIGQPAKTFCTQLCGFKEICFKENFCGE